MKKIILLAVVIASFNTSVVAQEMPNYYPIQLDHVYGNGGCNDVLSIVFTKKTDKEEFFRLARLAGIKNFDISGFPANYDYYSLQILIKVVRQHEKMKYPTRSSTLYSGLVAVMEGYNKCFPAPK